MSYDSEKALYSKEHIYVIEIDLDDCSLTHGVAPCTAIETGDDKCFNTFASCNDIPNYAVATNTYRFCSNRSPHPVGLDAIPSLLSVNIAPAEIDLGGGLGVRSSVNLTFKDHVHGDNQFDIDQYLSDRTYIASERGTFWTKFRARNPNYQFRELRVLSGYLVNGVYDSNNFQVRYYVIDRLNATRGRCTITAKDPLKLASRGKAQAPAPSTGAIGNVGGISAVATSITLAPSGVGNSEYDASGKVTVNKEVMNFTRAADVLTVVRGQNNTIAQTHAQTDAVQQALVYASIQVNAIEEDLLTNFANIDPSFIPSVAWQSEVDTYLSGFLEAVITKPTDVWKLLKELSQDMPHYLWWDERSQEIQFTALKAPPPSANVLNMDENFIGDSVRVSDQIQMRRSTIFVSYGQVDPTKNLDEKSNFSGTYARVDSDSIVEYGSNEVKNIFSRWISSVNKAAAIQLAALYGRRFADTPRMINFSLEDKDSDVWAGQNRVINHRDILGFTGLPVDTVFQILSVKESKKFDYKALEFTYGQELPGDAGGNPNLDVVILSVNDENINLRTIYDGLFPAPDAATEAKFIVSSGVIIGSTSSGGISVNTGSWPAGAVITLALESSSYIVGKGGDGSGNVTGAAANGGLGLFLSYDLTIENSGIIGGGGGGGGRSFGVGGGGSAHAAGGGGAGGNVGQKGGDTTYSGTNPFPAIIQSQLGTTELGGAGGNVQAATLIVSGGDGGDLGVAGVNGNITNGGAAGDAIDKNSFTMTETLLGDVRGGVVP